MAEFEMTMTSAPEALPVIPESTIEALEQNDVVQIGRLKREHEIEVNMGGLEEGSLNRQASASRIMTMIYKHGDAERHSVLSELSATHAERTIEESFYKLRVNEANEMKHDHELWKEVRQELLQQERDFPESKQALERLSRQGIYQQDNENLWYSDKQMSGQERAQALSDIKQLHGSYLIEKGHYIGVERFAHSKEQVVKDLGSPDRPRSAGYSFATLLNSLSTSNETEAREVLQNLPQKGRLEDSEFRAQFNRGFKEGVRSFYDESEADFPSDPRSIRAAEQREQFIQAFTASINKVESNRDLTISEPITIQTQRGIEERLKQPSLADPAYQASEQRIAIIEAELLGKKALGKEYEGYRQEPANTTSASYAGPIVAESEQFSIQKTTSTHTVRHEKSQLPEVPRIGQNVRINYAANVASIKQEPQQLQHTRRHTRSI